MTEDQRLLLIRRVGHCRAAGEDSEANAVEAALNLIRAFQETRQEDTWKFRAYHAPQRVVSMTPPPYTPTKFQKLRNRVLFQLRTWKMNFARKGTTT